MVALRGDKSWFEQRLAPLSRPDRLLLVGRAALRSLPLFNAHMPFEGGGKWHKNYSRHSVLPLLRCFPIVVVSAIYEKRGTILSAATHAVNDLDNVDLESEPNRRIVDIVAAISLASESISVLCEGLETFMGGPFVEYREQFIGAFEVDIAELDGSDAARGRLF